MIQGGAFVSRTGSLCPRVIGIGISSPAFHICMRYGTAESAKYSKKDKKNEAVKKREKEKQYGHHFAKG